MARRVDLRKLGDGRHLTQEPQCVEPALIEGAVGPWQLRGPAYLAFDLGDEFFDLIGGRYRLLFLDVDERRLVFLIGEPNFECPVGEKRQHDHRNEQNGVLDKQPTAHDRCAHRRTGLGDTTAVFVDIRFH